MLGKLFLLLGLSFLICKIIEMRMENFLQNYHEKCGRVCACDRCEVRFWSVAPQAELWVDQVSCVCGHAQ